METASQPSEKAEPRGGSETILLVEDYEGLREMIATSLRSAGYTVLETGRAQAAIELVAKHRGPVHLLLSDIVMPQSSGVQLFKLLKVSVPDLKVIFMSGYATEMLGRHDPLPPEAAFIEKPFAKDSLLSTIRTVLHERAAS